MTATPPATRRVQVLPPHIVNRIAAGEVVERPASVVKELVENAVDAGATRIEVFASAGGRTLRVADNGHGMHPEDAALAFTNHATSKITEESDLSAIETLGFRGEALASISAIARVTCLSRTVEASLGVKVTLNETTGHLPQVGEVGCAPGTVMEICDLFYNTPARLKFLKRPQTELGHIEETVQLLALSHPEIQFALTLNDQQVLKTTGSGQLRRAIEEVFKLNRPDLEALLPVQQEDATTGFTLAGYMSAPGVLKSSKRWLVTFVNGRVVRCPVLTKAIESAYAALIPDGKYPICVVFLSMPADEVDVNVHPTKKEVRYASPGDVFGFVRHGLVESLARQGHTVQPTLQVEPSPAADPLGYQPVQLSTHGPLSHWGSSAGSGSGLKTGATFPSGPRPTAGGLSQAALSFYEPSVGEDAVSSEPVGGVLEPVAPRWKVIGQLFNTYILLETQQGLMVVDQHIASERTFFEALTQRTLNEAADTVQRLIAVVPMPLTPLQVDLLVENQAAFSQLGFAYQLDAEARTVTLEAVPIIYQDRQPRDLFGSLLAQLEETGRMKLELDDMIATLACHSAVRAGDVLTQVEMTQVIDRWLACRLPWTCPHGRPIAHTIPTEELHHFFHRQSLPVNAR
jgi:DNA mismatch repair protein MutL